MLSPIQVSCDLSPGFVSSAQLTCTHITFVSLNDNGSEHVDLAPEVISHWCQPIAGFLLAHLISTAAAEGSMVGSKVGQCER